MNQRMMSQAVLQHESTRLVCWVEAGRAKVGDQITLKDHTNPDWRWNVLSMGVAMPKTSIKDFHDAEKWHENDYRRRLKGKLI